MDKELDLENYVLKLRQNIYGNISKESWVAVKVNWMKPDNVKWLENQPQNKEYLNKSKIT